MYSIIYSIYIYNIALRFVLSEIARTVAEDRRNTIALWQAHKHKFNFSIMCINENNRRSIRINNFELLFRNFFHHKHSRISISHTHSLNAIIVLIMIVLLS